MQYERAFTPKSTVALGISFMPQRSLPSSLTESDSSGFLKSFNITGFSVTPEYRWYPFNPDKNAPHGFYLAPYLRYSSYSLTGNYSFSDTTLKQTFNFPVTMKYGGFGVGLMFGKQWVISNRVTIDWWMLGGHFGSSTFDFSMGGDFSMIDQKQMQADLQESVNDLPLGKATAHVSNTAAGITWVGPFAGLRTGLALGIKF